MHVKSEIPLAFFNLYLKHPFQLTRQAVDAGVVQRDFIAIDIDTCFERLALFQATAGERLEAEIRWLKEENIDLVLSDCSSLPLKAAAALGLPSLVVSNFTWHDIYSHFPGAGRHQALIESLAEEYSHATLQLLPQLHTDGRAVPRRKEIGFIARRGRNRRQALLKRWPELLQGKTLVFIYLGEAGSARIDWPRLGLMENAVFLTRDPVAGTARNLLVLGDEFLYPDLIASCDLVVTKAGYSTLAAAFAHGKPVLSCTREHFREFDFIAPALKEGGLGGIIGDERFFSCDWGEDIEQARTLSVAGRVPMNGESELFAEIENLLA